MRLISILSTSLHSKSPTSDQQWGEEKGIRGQPTKAVILDSISLRWSLLPDPPSDDVIVKSIGNCGRWQCHVSFWMFLLKIPIAWHQLCIVFMAPPADFRCINETLDKCDPKCSEHIFDRSVFTETIVTEWDLVCDRVWLANLSQTVVMLGILIGNSIFGVMSDRFGRKNTLLLAVILQAITGPVAAIAPWYSLFIAMRFLVAMSTGGTMCASFVLLMEIIGKKYRTAVCVLYQLPFNFGHLSLPLFSYFFRNWHDYYLALSLPSVIFILMWCLVDESPRWLITVGRSENAIKILEKAARMNNMPTEGIKSNVMLSAEHAHSETKKPHIWDLFRTPKLRKSSTICCYNWFVCGFCFFGVAQYMGMIAENVFFNVGLSAVLQAPGTVIVLFIMEKWGRKPATILASLMGGISLISIAFIPADLNVQIAVCGMFGIFGLWMCFPTAYQFSGELYPTCLRTTGVGLCSMVARLGSMIAPFVTQLAVFGTWLPPILFGVVPLIGAVLTFMLPETLNCKLSDTIEEAENFRGTKNHKPIVT